MVDMQERRYLFLLRIVTLFLILSVGMNTIWAASWLKTASGSGQAASSESVNAAQLTDDKTNYEAFYEKKLKNLLTDEELNALAQKQWNYRLSVNGKQFTGNTIYIEGTSNVRIVLAEVADIDNALPQSILNEGSLWRGEEGKSLADYMTLYTNEFYEVSSEEDEGKIKYIYNFNNVPKGTVITLQLNALLKEKIDNEEQLKSNRVQVVVR